MNHSFDILVAQEFGIEEAILIHHFQHWILFNKKTKQNFREGKTWTYQTREWMSAHFGYLSKDQIKRTVKSLVDKGVLLVNNFNRNKMDRTTWYAFVDEDRWIPKNLYEKAKSPDGDSESPHDEAKSPDDIYGEDAKEKDAKKKEKCATKGVASKPIRLANSQVDVRTSDEEHEKLIEKYGPDLVATAYQELLDWKSSKAEVSPKELLKHTDYRRLTKWVIASLQEKNEKSPDEVKGVSNKDIALKIAQRFAPQGIEAFNTYIEFGKYAGALVLNYSEKGFKERAISQLRKMNLPVDWLM